MRAIRARDVPSRAVLLPVEVVAFVCMLLACNPGAVLWACAGAYAIYEAYKTLRPGFRVAAFRPEGQPYVPFVEESFYKAWGPLVLAIDASRADLRYLVVVPVYALLFRVHVRSEADRVRAVIASLRPSRATAASARSSEGP